MKQRLYTSAPLPFVGQKRKFVKTFRNLLERYPEDVTIVDLFGGSGLLSHVAKREKPAAKVVYNDYDNYRLRIANIPRTNALLARIRELTKEIPADKAMPHDVKARILELVAEEECTGFVDYITLSASVLFSMKYANNLAELSKETFYNRVKEHSYDATGYLDGLTVVSKDYRKLFDEYSDMPGVLFLVDPPYLSTDVKTYTMSWKLADYLDVLTILQGHDFVYFTSNKSQIIELCDWIGQQRLNCNPFENAQHIYVNTNMNYNTGYTDIMLYSSHHTPPAVPTPSLAVTLKPAS